MSSGWDSSSILAILKEYYPDVEIVPLIIELDYGIGKPVNYHELRKARLICDYFQLDLRIVKSIHTQDHLLNAAFDSLARRHSFAHTGLNHYVLREYISTNFPDLVVLLFIQVSLVMVHTIEDLVKILVPNIRTKVRMYADKINSYFYSPGF